MTFHLNPATGEPGPCQASKRSCPYGGSDGHFPTVKAAREAYEAIAEGRRAQPLSWLLTPPGVLLEESRPYESVLERIHYQTKDYWAGYEGDKDMGIPEALYSYTGWGAGLVNAHLRGATEAFDEPFTKEGRSQAEALVEGMDKALAHGVRGAPQRVYRAVELPAGITAKAYLAALEEDGTFLDEGYMSTSATYLYPTYRATAKGKATHVLMELVTTKAAPLQYSDLGSYDSIQTKEAELLLPRNTSWEVVRTQLKAPMKIGEGYRWLYERDPFRMRRVRSPEGQISLPLVQLVEKD